MKQPKTDAEGIWTALSSLPCKALLRLYQSVSAAASRSSLCVQLEIFLPAQPPSASKSPRDAFCRVIIPPSRTHRVRRSELDVRFLIPAKPGGIRQPSSLHQPSSVSVCSARLSGTPASLGLSQRRPHRASVPPSNGHQEHRVRLRKQAGV